MDTLTRPHLMTHMSTMMVPVDARPLFPANDLVPAAGLFCGPGTELQTSDPKLGASRIQASSNCRVPLKKTQTRETKHIFHAKTQRLATTHRPACESTANLHS